jgi:hypothetical protein
MSEVYPAVRRSKLQTLLFSPKCHIIFPDIEKENMEDYLCQLKDVEKKNSDIFSIKGCTFNLQDMTATLQGVQLTPTSWIETEYAKESLVFPLHCTREFAITALFYVYHMAVTV